MKYIKTVTEDGLYEIFIFPLNINHDHMAESLNTIRVDDDASGWVRTIRKPISAGFISPSFECYGKSETLNLRCGAGDTDFIRRQILGQTG